MISKSYALFRIIIIFVIKHKVLLPTGHRIPSHWNAVKLLIACGGRLLTKVTRCDYSRDQPHPRTATVGKSALKVSKFLAIRILSILRHLTGVVLVLLNNWKEEVIIKLMIFLSLDIQFRVGGGPAATQRQGPDRGRHWSVGCYLGFWRCSCWRSSSEHWHQGPWRRPLPPDHRMTWRSRTSLHHWIVLAGWRRHRSSWGTSGVPAGYSPHHWSQHRWSTAELLLGLGRSSADSPEK